MKKDVWLLDDADKWRILEQLFSIPVEQRLAWLIKEVEAKKVQHLGQTDKTAPELATEFIKKGVNAKSYGHKVQKEVKHDNNI